MKASPKLLLSADKILQKISFLWKGFFLITYQLLFKVNFVLLKDANSTTDRTEGPSEMHKDVHTPTSCSSSGATATWLSPKGAVSAEKSSSSV